MRQSLAEHLAHKFRLSLGLALKTFMGPSLNISEMMPLMPMTGLQIVGDSRSHLSDRTTLVLSWVVQLSFLLSARVTVVLSTAEAIGLSFFSLMRDCVFVNRW